MSQDLSHLITELKTEIPALMRREGVLGMSAALITERGIVWASGFGITDRVRRLPVTADTMFSLQSCSKTFTATAIMLAVKDGLLDMDLPIAAYLPGFALRSRYEEQPETVITLCHLLSHKAGLTHEAPVGNNYERNTDRVTFDAHIESIAHTWLRYPVGQQYAYSNLGIDLAGYILQKASGTPFPAYVQETLFDPLGLTASSFDPKTILQTDDRAIGHDVFLKAAGAPAPVIVPMLPSGGLYASVRDVARFVGFHLQKGRTNRQVLLNERYLHDMVTIPFPMPDQTTGYALGIAIGLGPGGLIHHHGGGGFGFLADMIWYPNLGIGIAVLTNSSNHRLQWTYANRVLNRIADLPEYQTRIPPAIKPDRPVPPPQDTVTPSDRLIGHYVGRIPDSARVRRGTHTMEICLPWSKKPLPLSFTSEHTCFTVVNGRIIQYRFATDNTGAPLRLVCLANGQVYDYNDGPYDPPGPCVSDWRAHMGTYMALILGAVPQVARVIRRRGYLSLRLITSRTELRLSEHQPGLFFTTSGEALEFRDNALVLGGITYARITRGTELRQWVVLGRGSLILWHRRILAVLLETLKKWVHRLSPSL